MVTPSPPLFLSKMRVKNGGVLSKIKLGVFKNIRDPAWAMAIVLDLLCCFDREFPFLDRVHFNNTSAASVVTLDIWRKASGALLIRVSSV